MIAVVGTDESRRSVTSKFVGNGASGSVVVVGGVVDVVVGLAAVLDPGIWFGAVVEVVAEVVGGLAVVVVVEVTGGTIGSFSESGADVDGGSGAPPPPLSSSPPPGSAAASDGSSLSSSEPCERTTPATAAMAITAAATREATIFLLANLRTVT